MNQTTFLLLAVFLAGALAAQPPQSPQVYATNSIVFVEINSRDLCRRVTVPKGAKAHISARGDGEGGWVALRKDDQLLVETNLRDDWKVEYIIHESGNVCLVFRANKTESYARAIGPELHWEMRRPHAH